MPSEQQQKKMLVRVVVKKPGQVPQVRMIKNTTAVLKRILAANYSALLGVWLSATYDRSHNLAMITDNAARMLGQPNLNRASDVVMGTAIIVRFDPDIEQQADLTDEQVASVLAWCERADHRHDTRRKPRQPKQVVATWDRSETAQG